MMMLHQSPCNLIFTFKEIEPIYFDDYDQSPTGVGFPNGFKNTTNTKISVFLSDKNSSLDYVDAKNLFRRVKLREDIQNILTLFDKYEIPEGFRPENVAEDLYGSDQLDWVVIVSCGYS